jgi:hypothetical protein
MLDFETIVRLSDEAVFTAYHQKTFIDHYSGHNLIRRHTNRVSFERTVKI